VPHKSIGYVTRFEVRREFLDRYEIRQAGGRDVLEYHIPAEDLPGLNASIAGRIVEETCYRGPVPGGDFDRPEAGLGVPDSVTQFIVRVEDGTFRFRFR
jgi:hypothetical protein